MISIGVALYAVCLVALAGLAVYWSWDARRHAKIAAINTHYLRIQMENLITASDPYKAKTRFFTAVPPSR